MNSVKNVIMVAVLMGIGLTARASESTISCSHEGSFRTIYVTVQPTKVDGIFRATISELPKFTYSIPGDPLPVLAEYNQVFHNQHMDLYRTTDGQFILRVGESPVVHLTAGELDMDMDSCSQE